MADKYSDSDLVGKMHTPGWTLETGKGDKPVTGTLADVAKATHERQAKGERPGLVREIETEIEVDLIQLGILWRTLGLPT